MKAREIMTQDIKCIEANRPVVEAARQMRDYDVGSLPVLDGTRFVGVVTDRDICCRVVADGLDPNSTEVRKAMTSSPICVKPDTDIDEVAEVMRDNQIRRIPVVAEDDELVGYIALRDLAIHGASKEQSHEVIEGVSA